MSIGGRCLAKCRRGLRFARQRRRLYYIVRKN
jgi:hypothetical protein